MFFRDVIGQEEIKRRLIQEVREGRIPHAQLICGPEGVGKMPLAIAYARYISCTNRGETDACGVCPSCVKFNKLVHPDVHFVFPIVKSAKGKKEVCDDYIADWRPFVINNPYFNLNHWLNEMDAENSQALIYAKESDEILKKLSLKSSEGGFKITIVWLPENFVQTHNKFITAGRFRRRIYFFICGVWISKDCPYLLMSLLNQISHSLIRCVRIIQ